MPFVQPKPEPVKRRIRLTATEKAFLRWLDRGLTVEAAAARIGKCRRTGFNLLADLRASHQIATADQ